MRYFLYVSGGLLLVLVFVILFNTVRYSKELPKHATQPITGISDSAALHLSEAIQIKTVSYGESLPIDSAAFHAFRRFMEVTYPLVHQQLERTIFSEFSFVYKWQGRNASLKPYVIMAHMDVVPVEEAAEKNWSVPSFSGTIKDNYIWGRGAVDDKSSLVAILEAAEQLLSQNYQPERNIYLCFGHDEEIAGLRGMKLIAEWFKSNNIQPEMVLDEGGEVNTQNMKELNRPLAVLGVGEKGYVTYQLQIEKAGGHSSMPEKETAIDILTRALSKLRQKQMPARITDPVQQMFNTIGPGMSFTSRMAFANPWLFKSLTIRQLEKNNRTNAMVHTTVVPTIIQAGVKDNVIPTVATATVNSRILPGETSADVENFIKKTINDDRIQVQRVEKLTIEPSKTTPVSSHAYQIISSIVYKMVPDVVVSPYLVIGATDSRYFRDFADGVINFLPIIDTKGFHGVDERVGVEDLKRMIFFYKAVMQENK